jgi:hypothetical protein
MISTSSAASFRAGWARVVDLPGQRRGARGADECGQDLCEPPGGRRCTRRPAARALASGVHGRRRRWRARSSARWRFARVGPFVSRPLAAGTRPHPLPAPSPGHNPFTDTATAGKGDSPITVVVQAPGWPAWPKVPGGRRRVFGAREPPGSVRHLMQRDQPRKSEARASPPFGAGAGTAASIS